MTPHIQAKKGEIAKIVLMPGDPLRAKYVAETFLDNYKLVNKVRNMLMYTGTYKGKEISVCGSGMGQPSIGIYAYELFKFYGVEKIIRIGSAGSYVERLKIYDVVLVKQAYSESNLFAKHLLNETTHTLFPSPKLNKEMVEIANKLNIPLHIANANTSDVFYSSIPYQTRMKEANAECSAMESYALFAAALAFKKEAATLLTISDSYLSKPSANSKERETAFSKMMEIALETIIL